MATSREIREQLSAALGTTELTDTGLVLLNRQTPASIGDRTWTLMFNQTSNSNKLRDRDHVRHRHNAQIQLSHKLKPKDQSTTMDEALDDADKVIRAVMTFLPLRAICRVEWVSTSRNLSPSGDFIYSVITLDLESNDDLF